MTVIMAAITAATMTAINTGRCGCQYRRRSGAGTGQGSGDRRCFRHLADALCDIPDRTRWNAGKKKELRIT